MKKHNWLRFCFLSAVMTTSSVTVATQREKRHNYIPLQKQIPYTEIDLTPPPEKTLVTNIPIGFFAEQAVKLAQIPLPEKFAVNIKEELAIDTKAAEHAIVKHIKPKSDSADIACSVFVVSFNTVGLLPNSNIMNPVVVHSVFKINGAITADTIPLQHSFRQISVSNNEIENQQDYIKTAQELAIKQGRMHPNLTLFRTDYASQEACYLIGIPLGMST